MAFPLESAHIISHLRSSYLVQFDDDDDAKRLMKPYLEDADGDSYKPIFDRLTLSSSPPIQLHSTGSNGNGISYNSASRSSKSVRSKRNARQRRARKSIASASTESASTEPASTEPAAEQVGSGEGTNQAILQPSFDRFYDTADDVDIEFSADDDEAQHDVKPKPRKKSGILRIFSGNSDKNSSLSDSDSSDGSVRSTIIAPDPTNESTPLQEPGSFKDELADEEGHKKTNKAGESGDSDLATLNSSKSDHKLMSGGTSPSGSSVSNPIEQDDSYFDDSDDALDDEEDIEEGSSTDSAFTDIETDSIMNSSLLLDSFDTTEFSYKKSNALASKMRKKKSRINSFGGLNSGKSNANFKSKTPVTSNSAIDLKTPPMNFEKVVPPPGPQNDSNKISNLSSLIQSRSKSANSNPLNYYSFVNNDVTTKATKALLDIFVPPKTTPTLNNLAVNNNVAIVDCIGYILLQLSDTSDFKTNEDFNSLDPNHWRLELVDEDGENYGSFGILDRTRLLSSYNNPKELAICRVEDEKEIEKNEKQTPLAVEFKQDLMAFRRKRLLYDTNESAGSGTAENMEKIELTIITSDGSKASLQVDGNASVQEAIYDFCTARNLNPDNYKFWVVGTESKDFLSDNSNDASTLKATSTMNDNSGKRLLMNDELIRDLGSTLLQIVPAKTRPVRSLLNNNSLERSPIDHNISPGADINIITPPRNSAGVLPSTTHMRLTEATKKQDKPIKPAKSTKTSAQDSNKYFDDLMTGMNSQLPSNSKTKYFTWKVWRKKTTILNKIEKSLIIDGDYIRLQPPEDKAYTKDPNDNPFLASQGGHSHHHHLHHYNYSNYYNGSMMKTSSFHITQLVKLKQYKGSKNPNHFKIVIEKPGKDSTPIKKKYDLEAVSESECEAIIEKIRWVSKVYKAEMANIK